MSARHSPGHSVQVRAGGELDERPLRGPAGPRGRAVRVLRRRRARQPRPVLRHRRPLPLSDTNTQHCTGIKSTVCYLKFKGTVILVFILFLIMFSFVWLKGNCVFPKCNLRSKRRRYRNSSDYQYNIELLCTSIELRCLIIYLPTDCENQKYLYNLFIYKGVYYTVLLLLSQNLIKLLLRNRTRITSSIYLKISNS